MSVTTTEREAAMDYANNLARPELRSMVTMSRSEYRDHLYLTYRAGYSKAIEDAARIADKYEMDCGIADKFEAGIQISWVANDIRALLEAK